MKAIKYIVLILFGVISINVCAQNNNSERFAIKASAEIGLGNSISSNSYISSLSSKATTGSYGLDFGWTFWSQKGHRLEANIGVAYSPAAIELELGSFDYNYGAPATADMDGESYQRYYEISNLHQKVSLGRVTLPIYLTYGYKCNGWFGLHADLGVRFGFKTNATISEVSGEAYSYGIYPQYDNLLIDESYLNDFGTTNLANAGYGTPVCNGFSTSVLVGVGAEFSISKHLGADISVRYNRGITNLFKEQYSGQDFTNASAPINYSVSDGQQVKSLTDYLSSSKVSPLSLRIALIYRF
ncbi:MAG: outer membrane beta-barrel protein [Paramuribaculum sp.]|nr:outer membrane beta-barrel protein [Paramuribaculum sp.]